LTKTKRSDREVQVQIQPEGERKVSAAQTEDNVQRLVIDRFKRESSELTTSTQHPKQGMMAEHGVQFQSAQTRFTICIAASMNSISNG
jgi:hypothetical protein